MCNCTSPQGLAQEIRHPSPESDKPAHNPSVPDPEPPIPLTPRTKKIALDPAESSAIYDAPLVLA